MIIVVRTVFHEDSKYPQVSLDECLCKLKISEFDRLAVFQGIDVNETMIYICVLFAIAATFLIKMLDFSQMYVMVVMI